MRAAALLSVICAFIALILSFLCMFAGSKPGMMEDYHIVTFNTSRIAVDIFNETVPSANDESGTDEGGIRGWFHNVENKTKNEFHIWSNELQQEIEDDINSVLKSIAKSLGLHDFYSVHVLDFCEGFYTPFTNSTTKNVTHCSNSTSLFTFNITSVLQEELDGAGADVDLSDLHWPQAIEDVLRALRTAFKAMFVLYCISVIFISGSLLWSSVGIFTRGRGTASINLITAWLAVFCMLIASSVVSYAADKTTDAVNKYGKDINVSAQRGGRFIALTWAATALMAIVGLAWSWEACSGRKKEKMIPKKWEG